MNYVGTNTWDDCSSSEGSIAYPRRQDLKSCHVALAPQPQQRSKTPHQLAALVDPARVSTFGGASEGAGVPSAVGSSAAASKQRTTDQRRKVPPRAKSNLRILTRAQVARLYQRGPGDASEGGSSTAYPARPLKWEHSARSRRLGANSFSSASFRAVYLHDAPEEAWPCGRGVVSNLPMRTSDTRSSSGPDAWSKVRLGSSTISSASSNLSDGCAGLDGKLGDDSVDVPESRSSGQVSSTAHAWLVAVCSWARLLQAKRSSWY